MSELRDAIVRVHSLRLNRGAKNEHHQTFGKARAVSGLDAAPYGAAPGLREALALAQAMNEERERELRRGASIEVDYHRMDAAAPVLPKPQDGDEEVGGG